ncbi:MAG: ATP-binding cassette domain-containing protein [Myxococcales bacterium]|nr:ATP-binding cassette domain-containing protein [Myxococcales bacterium]
MTAPTIALRVRASRRFGACVALADGQLEVEAGTVHALVGENGAGKSTLMRIVYGLERADGGELELGERVELARHSVARAQALGVGMVHQHGMLVPTLTLAENAALGHEPMRGGLLDRAGAGRALVAAAAQLGQTLDPDALAGALTVGEQQRAELAMVSARASRLLILDEPTALLTPAEVDALLDMIRARADAGGAVVLVTHKLDEVVRVADEVTVLRGGRTVASWSADVTTAEIARAMIGGEPPPPSARAPAPAADATAGLTVRELVAPGARGGGAVGVSLAVKAGEIVGVAGVEGNGQRELGLAIAGLGPVAAGTVAIGGADVTRASVAARRALGLAHLPEDRHLHGLVADATVADNVALGRLAEVTTGVTIDRGALARLTAHALGALDVRPADPDARAGALSGGNQQKLVVARELDRPGLRAVLAVHPTRGVDLTAVARIHARLRQAAIDGAAVLLIASDLDELLALAHRVLVMHRGHVVGELAGAALTAADARTRLGAWMAGASP